MHRMGTEHSVANVDFGQWRRKPPLLVLLLFIFLGLSLTACDRHPAPETASIKATLPPQQDSRTEWVVLIDNSKSITPAEQVLIREAAMLLADLSDPGDRLAVITFGSQANQTASMAIQNDQDRRHFQDLVRTNVDFKENFSDLRAGLHLLAEQRQSLFPNENAHHAAIMLSDGLLEPADHKPFPAIQEIKDSLQGPLQNLDIFAIVLGATSSQKNIPGLTPLQTGQRLMEEIAGQPQRFTRADKLDQVLDTTLGILKSVKGISSANDSDATYRIDKTVATMTLIVRKKTVDGKELANSNDIKLETPNTAPPAGSNQDTIYHNSNYQYFDLFVVRNPRPGEWRVTLNNGQRPQVLSKIDSPIQLHAQGKPLYYLNESGVLWAWLFDAKQQAVSHGDYQIQAHIVNAGEKAAQSYLPFSLDADSGQFFLEMPNAVKQILPTPDQPARVELEIKATQNTDPMFLRQARVKSDFSTPLIVWNQPGEKVVHKDESGGALARFLNKWTQMSGPVRFPFTTSTLNFGGDLETQHPDYPAFDVPPILKLSIEVFDKDRLHYQPLSVDSLQPEVTNANKLVYVIAKPFNDYRQYRYRYELVGQTAQGEQSIKSHWYELQLGIPWIRIGIAAGVLLLFLHIAGRWLAKLRGRVEVNSNGIFTFQEVKTKPEFNYQEGGVRFKVRPQRTLWFRKRLVLIALGGEFHIDGDTLGAGKSKSLRPRVKHTLTFDNTKLELKLHVI